MRMHDKGKITIMAGEDGGEEEQEAYHKNTQKKGGGGRKKIQKLYRKWRGRMEGRRRRKHVLSSVLESWQ